MRTADWEAHCKYVLRGCLYMCRYGGQADLDKVLTWPLSKLRFCVEQISSFVRAEYPDE